MSRQSYREQASTRLLSLWERRAEFGEPIGCVASTYTLDAPFFEEQCLARFVALESDPQEAEDSRVYLVEREERLSQIRACVIVDKDHVPERRSLRWDLLPITLEGAGVMHAKLSLLVWQKRVRLLVGSANLTEPGYRQNYEHVAVLEFGPEGSLPRRLLDEALEWLERLVGLAPGRVQRKEGPQVAALGLMSRARRLSRRWPRGGWGRGPRAVLLPVWPGEASLFSRIGQSLWSGQSPTRAEILSPFYDPDPRAAAAILKGLLAIMAPRNRRLVFCGSGRALPRGIVELDVPEQFRQPVAASDRHAFRLVEQGDQEPRALHAKALWLERDRRVAFVVGSSNFTMAGTGGPARRACNVELNVGYWIPSSHSPFGRVCRMAYPPFRDLEADARYLHLLTPEVQTPEPSRFDGLPRSFGLALYRVQDGKAWLSLEISGTPPLGFTVLTEERARLADDGNWSKQGRPSSFDALLVEDRPPSCVYVEWREGRELHRAVWPVNVADASSLPAPEELRSLSLEELMEVLTSARPLHEVVRTILRRRAQARRAGSVAAHEEVDPHKKVDTSGFLLQRMRRLGRALEGIRRRLQQPVHSVEALRWRLHGPVGPLKLADRLAADTAGNTGAAFFIAELARTVKREVDWTQAAKALGDKAVRSEIRTAMGLLNERARGCAANPELQRYVSEVFRR
jgi:hypothetical protein